MSRNRAKCYVVLGVVMYLGAHQIYRRTKAALKAFVDPSLTEGDEVWVRMGHRS